MKVASSKLFSVSKTEGRDEWTKVDGNGKDTNSGAGSSIAKRSSS